MKEIHSLLDDGFALADEDDGEGEEQDDNETASRSHGDVHCPSVSYHRLCFSHRHLIYPSASIKSLVKLCQT